MLEGITSEELTEILEAGQWIGLETRRQDARTAMLALVVARSAGNKRPKFKDFMHPDEGPEGESDEPQSREAMDFAMLKLAALFPEKTHGS